MSDACRTVEETIACGEKLSPQANEHVASCEACAEIRRISQTLSSALGAAAEATVPLGLTPRLNQSVGQRLTQSPIYRARAIVLGASVLAAAALILVLRGGGAEKGAGQSTVQVAVTANTDSSASEAPGGARAAIPSPSESELLQVVFLSDVEGSLSASADWDRYLEPISATELLVQEAGQ